MVDWLVGNTVLSETALRIFLIFCVKLRDYKGRNITEPDFWTKFLIWRYSWKGVQISVGWLVGNTVFSETVRRIFLIFCMKLGGYKFRKFIEQDFLKSFWFEDICEKLSKLAWIGWLRAWLIGNAVSSETALRTFLIFCMKLGDYKGRKVTELDFFLKILIWKYSQKGLQISPKSEALIFFPKTAQTIFLVFGLKLVLNVTFNFNEIYFSEKISIWRYLTSKSSKKMFKLRFLAILLTLHY